MFAFYHFYQLFAIVQYGNLPKLSRERYSQIQQLTDEANDQVNRKPLTSITATLKFCAK